MNIQAWHSRYVLQALWTAKLRQFLLNQVNARPGEQILEVGSGTGALFPGFESRGLRVVGLKRVRIGRIMLGDLPQGQWRFLRADEHF